MADRGRRIATIAAAHAGCSAVLDVDRYNDVIVREADRNPRTLPYYDSNPHLSTCALFACGVLRLAGCTEPEAVATYFPGGSMRNAMADIQNLARRYGAWVTGSPPVPSMHAGDIWVIGDDAGGDAHTGVCVGDAVSGPSGTWVVLTCEGGQMAVDASGHASAAGGSTAIGAFTRTWRFVGGRWVLGARFLLGYAAAAQLPVPDDVAPTVGD